MWFDLQRLGLVEQLVVFPVLMGAIPGCSLPAYVLETV